MRAIALALALLIAPSFAEAQKSGTVRYGKCGDTSLEDDMVPYLYGSLFVDDDQADTRASFGIPQHEPGFPMSVIRDERVCGSLLGAVRDALNVIYPGRARASDFLLTFMRFGTYYGVAVNYKPGELPEGVRTATPFIIIDWDGRKYLGQVWKQP
ncbi:MAG TPA: hypothetical protein VF584_18750 [Longimicrobium sp.]|jgi:hypothetical protein